MQGRYDAQQRLYVTFNAPGSVAPFIGSPMPQSVVSFVNEGLSFGDQTGVVLVPRVVPLWERTRNRIVEIWGATWDFLNRPLFPGLATARWIDWRFM